MPQLPTELDRKAFDAVREHLEKPLVFLAAGAIGPNMRTTGNGTGTLLRSAGGKLLVLTARHLFEDDPPEQWAIGGKAPEGVDDALGRSYWHPSVDVAIAALKPHAATKLAAYALPVSAIADDGRFDPDVHQALVCGFPSAYRATEVDKQAKRATVHFQSVTYGTSVHGVDERGRYCVRWREWYSHDEASDKLLGGHPGDALAHPRGISGGPLWRFEHARDGEIWDPSRVGRIIGVATAYLEPHEFAPSVDTWGDWFRDAIVEIDSETRV